MAQSSLSIHAKTRRHMPQDDRVEELLNTISAGELARGKLAELVLEEFRRIAAEQLRSEHNGHTLQATALADEAFARLLNRGTLRNMSIRRNFFSAAANAMRCILVDHARRKNALKRGGGEAQRVPLTEILDRTVDDFERQNEVSLIELDDGGTLDDSQPSEDQRHWRKQYNQWWSG
jgi:RNA polymerase sigma factor (TIGR02999 family)